MKLNVLVIDSFLVQYF